MTRRSFAFLFGCLLVSSGAMAADCHGPQSALSPWGEGYCLRHPEIRYFNEEQARKDEAMDDNLRAIGLDPRLAHIPAGAPVTTTPIPYGSGTIQQDGQTTIMRGR